MDVVFEAESAAMAQRWARSISRSMIGLPLDGPPLPRRRILILVNPHSGKGNASKIFKKHALPVLQRAFLDIMVQETEYAGHARDLGASLDLDTVDGLVTCGGDGILWELVNGLLHREDWKRARRIPVGVLPGGSGNGVAENIGVKDPVTAALAVSRGYHSALDIFSVFQGGNRYYCFLSLTHAAIANADVGTDSCRCCGDFRFVLGALREVFLRRHSNMRLHFLEDHGFQSPWRNDRQNSFSPVSPEDMNFDESAISQDCVHLESSGVCCVSLVHPCCLWWKTRTVVSMIESVHIHPYSSPWRSLVCLLSFVLQIKSMFWSTTQRLVAAAPVGRKVHFLAGTQTGSLKRTTISCLLCLAARILAAM